MFSTLTVIAPCAITASDSFLAHKASMVPLVDALLESYAFLGFSITIIYWLIGRWSFFVEKGP